MPTAVRVSHLPHIVGDADDRVGVAVAGVGVAVVVVVVGVGGVGVVVVGGG